MILSKTCPNPQDPGKHDNTDTRGNNNDPKIIIPGEHSPSDLLFGMRKTNLNNPAPKPYIYQNIRSGLQKERGPHVPRWELHILSSGEHPLKESPPLLLHQLEQWSEA